MDIGMPEKPIRKVMAPSSSEPAAKQMLRHVRRWVCGFAISTLMMWMVSWYFIESVIPVEPGPVANRLVPVNGHVHRFRREGWAESHFGKYGIIGIPDVTEVRTMKVAIWGDSYVEAHQVPDEDKVAQQVTSISSSTAIPVTGVGIALSGWCVADYLFMLSQYEELVDPVCHVIVVSDINDVFPNGKTFKASPDLMFVDIPGGCITKSIRPWVERLRLQFLWTLFYNAAKGTDGNWRKLRFHPGPVDVKAPKPLPKNLIGGRESLMAWRYLLETVKNHTSRPVIFVYGPAVPGIADGKMIDDDPDAQIVAGFKQTCDAHGVGFVDLSESFRRFYRSTGDFASGFHNGFPSQGHWNKHGHRLAAKAIVNYIREHNIAVLPD